jgi:type IV pilus assembly protein PilW
MKTAHDLIARCQGGFSLVELMVATVIGLLVMAGILGLFVTNKGVFVNTTQATELQENGRFALGYLLRDLRNAYFFGETHFNNLDLDEEGPSNSDVKNNCEGAYAIYSFTADSTPASFPLVGTTANAREAIGCIDDVLIVNGIPSDILVIKSALPEQATSTDDLISNHVYIASNRLRGCLRQFGGDTAMPSLSPTCVAVGCDCLRNGSYWPYWFAAYYIRDIDPTDDEPPTLSRMVMEWDDADGMTVVEEDLVEGVEGMRVLYGIEDETDANPPTYYPSDQIGDWSEVVSVQVYLLLRGTRPDPSYQDSRTYQMGDRTVTATDGTQVSQGAQLRNFHRQVISTSVRLRNRQYIRFYADEDAL